jgi:hypothetical protein
MKKMVFCIIPLVIVLMGCASTPTNPGGGGDNDGTAQAAKLAKDLNAAKPGSTVTLSGRAGLKTALTVSEGVTLDLTQEGAILELQDGAVLTVNGTVNATGHGDHGTGWVEGSLRTGDGAAVIAGTGTISLKSKGRLLNIGSDKGKRQLTLDGVTLVGLPDNDSPLVGIGENSEFVLKSGAITGNTHVSDKSASGGGVDVWRGTFTMEDGAISGNSAEGKDGSSGGGVQIGEEAVFTMQGGTISDNNAQGKSSGSGGGVEVSKGGTFILEEGSISGNSTQYGGGVWEWGGSTFTMKGGTISGNSARDGGGVFVERGASFTKTGGPIYGDSDSTHTDDSTENTARNNRGHAVHYQTDPKYRNATLGPGDNISTSNLSVNWDN